MFKKRVGKRQPKLSSRQLLIAICGLGIIVFLMIYRLGSLTHGLTTAESSVTSISLGWHGLYRHPLNLPLNILRSIDFKIFASPGQTLIRLPNAVLGGLTIIAFSVLLWLWYGTRTAAFGAIMFASAAWTLHVSRLASYSVEYLAAITFFLLSNAILQKHPKNKYAYIAINLVWGLLLYVPGMVWFIALNIWRQRREVKYGYRQQSGLITKPLYFLSLIIWIPLLALDFIRIPNDLVLWLGLPTKLSPSLTIIKEFFGTFTHIFFRGPEYPSLWLGKAPILDLFSLIVAVIGIYFYAKHIKAGRSRLLFTSFLIGAVLIGLGGSVDLSIVIPIVYLWIAAGIAYLLQQWLAVFPKNPIARGIGYGFIVLAVGLSCTYNLRSYFVAFPNNPTNQAVFDVRR
jgi:hypothetical protein